MIDLQICDLSLSIFDESLGVFNLASGQCKRVLDREDLRLGCLELTPEVQDALLQFSSQFAAGHDSTGDGARLAAILRRVHY